MLNIRNLHAYYGKSHVLHGVEFDVRPGEIHQINWNFDDGTTGYVGYVRDVDTVLEKDTWKTVLRFILYREVY